LKIVVTETEYKKGEAIFTSTSEEIQCIPSPAEEDLLAEKVASSQAKYVIVGINQYRGPLYEALPKGGVIARFGVGHDGIDKEKVRSRSLYCTNTPDVLTHSVAELTISLIMMSARHMADVTQSIKNAQWQQRIGTELKDKTLAIIGCGPIGNRVAQIASFGLNMIVIGNDIRVLDLDMMKLKHGYHKIVSEFAQAVAEADFVSLHMPLKESTKLFLDANRIKMLPDRAWLINTSRGAIVEEIALFKALQSGKIAGAALDVFMHEPYEPVDQKYDLRLLDNVIFTPHIGSTTSEANRRMAERCLKNIKYADRGDYEKMDLVAGPK
jgi:phosphoglycerate dehydrogenase-like enzyme